MAAAGFLKIVNLIFLFMGIGFIAACGYVYSGYKVDQLDALVFPREVALGGLIIGGFITLTAFLGHYGATSQKKAVLTIYLLIVVLIIAAQVGVAWFATKRRGELDQIVSDQIWNNTKVTDETRNFIQEKFQCCGFKNPSDNPGSKCPIIPNITGCYQKVIDYQKNELQKVYISFFVLLLVEGLCVVSALALCRKK